MFLAVTILESLLINEFTKLFPTFLNGLLLQKNCLIILTDALNAVPLFFHIVFIDYASTVLHYIFVI